MYLDIASKSILQEINDCAYEKKKIKLNSKYQNKKKKLMQKSSINVTWFPRKLINSPTKVYFEKDEKCDSEM